jgi:protocatechuate 3,4-dioxygenase beta subunit
MRASGYFLRFGILTLAVHLFAVSGLAQETDVQLPTTPDTTANSKTDGGSYSLSGTVINAVTGEPVRHAAVQVSGQTGSVTLTDAGGHFVLAGLAEGKVILKAMKPGFYDDEWSHTASAQVGKDAPAVLLKLTPWGVISGRVTTKDQQPLEGFQIRTLAKQNVGGRLIWIDQPNQALTNEDGEYRVVGLQAGTYYLAVDQSSVTTLSQKGVANAREQIFTKVFYPGVSDLSSATPIEIVPGREVEAHFTLSAEPMYQVSGTLAGASNVVTGLTFSRKVGDDADFTQTADLQDGKFQVKLPAGAYSVGGDTRDGMAVTTPGATVMIRSDEADLQVPLNAAATIPVEIVKEQGAAGSERRVAVQPLQGIVPGLLMQLVPLSQSRRRNYFWGGQAGGIPNVAPGTYRLEISSNTPGEWWVKSARSGGVDLLSDDLIVPEGGQPDSIEVILRDGAGMVTGTVTPAGDPGRVLVLLVQPHGARNIIHAARMQGNFAFAGIPPGDYAILALDGGDQLEYADPEILNPYLTDAEHVSVRPRATVTVNLGLTSLKR